jgi:glycosyltransferase involved in cell wall biosynthesis
VVAQPNGGVTSAVNAAYENCKGDVIALLDSDDVCEPSKLEQVLKTFRESPRSGFCANRLLDVSATGQPIGEPAWPANADYGWLGPAKLRRGAPVTSRRHRASASGGRLLGRYSAYLWR